LLDVGERVMTKLAQRRGRLMRSDGSETQE
jgi:hypothetical protein